MVLVKRIIPGVCKIQLTMPFRMDHVNVYLLEGSPLTLIDTGPMMKGVEEDLTRAMQQLGYRPSQLQRIVLTHSHPDHMGLAARLREDSGAELLCHRLAAPKVTDYRGAVVEEMEELLQFSLMLGLSPDLMRTNQRMMDQWLEVAGSTQADRLLEGGELLEGDPFRLKVIYTPGHSLDHIVLSLPDYFLIVTGDLLLDKITPNPDIYRGEDGDMKSGLPAYLESISSLIDLPVIQAFPGHGNCISDFRGRIRDILTHHEQRQRYIVANLRGREMTILAMGLDLIQFVQADMSPSNIFLAMREVFGHLVLLEKDEKVIREVREGTWYYHVE
jgi:glyoxylase-like metal-dependent hydrolase (beta-lactamase superfamily II)